MSFKPSTPGLSAWLMLCAGGSQVEGPTDKQLLGARLPVFWKLSG